MNDLILQRCYHHAAREAAARCPLCSQFYCRECVIEHEGRMICAVCLRGLNRPQNRDGRFFSWGSWIVQGVFGLALAWYLFFEVGRVLVVNPSDFHSQTLWQNQGGDHR